MHYYLIPDVKRLKESKYDYKSICNCELLFNSFAFYKDKEQLTL